MSNWYKATFERKYKHWMGYLLRDKQEFEARLSKLYKVWYTADHPLIYVGAFDNFHLALGHKEGAGVVLNDAGTHYFVYDPSDLPVYDKETLENALQRTKRVVEAQSILTPPFTHKAALNATLRGAWVGTDDVNRWLAWGFEPTALTRPGVEGFGVEVLLVRNPESPFHARRLQLAWSISD